MRVYEKHWRSQIAYVNQHNCYALAFFSEGMIQKVVVKQVGGPIVDFTVDLFNSRRACGSGSLSSGGNSPGGFYTADLELYKVFETFNGTAGEAVKFIETAGRAYRNMDGDETKHPMFIYLQVVPQHGHPSPGDQNANTGDETTWDIAIGGWTDVS